MKTEYTLRIYADCFGVLKNQFFCWSVKDYEAGIILYLKFASPTHTKIRAAFLSPPDQAGIRFDKLMARNNFEQINRDLYKISYKDSDDFMSKMLERQKLLQELTGKVKLDPRGWQS